MKENMLKINFSLIFVVICFFISTTVAAGEIDFKSPREAIPLTHEKFLNHPADFQFAIVSDRTGGHRAGIFQKAVTYLNLLRPEFVINVGDSIEGYVEDPAVIEAQWKEFDDLVNQLEMPFFRVAGNHDLNTIASQNIWKASYGREYYYFVYKNVLFLCVSTEDPPIRPTRELREENDRLEKAIKEEKDPVKKKELIKKRGEFLGRILVTRISDKQIDYFRDVISDHSTVRWTFVLLHKPAWVEPPAQAAGFEKIERLLADRSYTVIAGHFHGYNYSQRNGREYIRLATTGGGSSLKKEKGFFDHIMWVTMTDAGPVMCNLLLDGFLTKKGKTN